MFSGNSTQMKNAPVGVIHLHPAGRYSCRAASRACARRWYMSTLAAKTACQSTSRRYFAAMDWLSGEGQISEASAVGTKLACTIAGASAHPMRIPGRSEEHTSELQSRGHLVCRLLLEK